jgi:HAD superfamily hydrolase (TIGR01457 family)
MDTEKLARLRFFLIDMDGTVYLGPNLIPGAADFIAYLQRTGRRFLFFTNNPTRDAAAYREKLNTMGIAVRQEDILTSGAATARFLAHETPYRRLYVLGTPVFEEELRRNGLEPGAKDPEAVVLSFDTTLTYRKLEKACLLLQKGLPYIATNPDRVCPADYGDIPDCGAMAALIESATGRRPRYIGKPNPAMARLGMRRIGADPARTAMIGDRLYTDIEMAALAGITAILVLSGETRRRDLNGAEQQPHFVFESVEALHQALAAADTVRWPTG